MFALPLKSENSNALARVNMLTDVSYIHPDASCLQYTNTLNLSSAILAKHVLVNTTVTIQPSPYRAPEVLLGIPFTPMVDIWNIGVMVSG